MKPRKTFSINIRHYASISFDAHFTSTWEQIVTSIVLIIFLGGFTYPLYLDGGGMIFWILLSSMFIIFLSLLFDLYFGIIKLLQKPKKD
jgi:hypothetical protein